MIIESEMNLGFSLVLTKIVGGDGLFSIHFIGALKSMLFLSISPSIEKYHEPHLSS